MIKFTNWFGGIFCSKLSLLFFFFNSEEWKSGKLEGKRIFWNCQCKDFSSWVAYDIWFQFTTDCHSRRGSRDRWETGKIVRLLIWELIVKICVQCYAHVQLFISDLIRKEATLMLPVSSHLELSTCFSIYLFRIWSLNLKKDHIHTCLYPLKLWSLLSRPSKWRDWIWFVTLLLFLLAKSLLSQCNKTESKPLNSDCWSTLCD